MERCLSGRKETLGERSYGSNCTRGSNPRLSAIDLQAYLQSAKEAEIADGTDKEIFKKHRVQYSNKKKIIEKYVLNEQIKLKI